MKRTPTPAEIVIMASGAVALIFSFFDFYKVDGPFGSDSQSAWSSGLFPLATYIPIIGVILGVGVALAVFAGVEMPEKIAGFTIPQVDLVLALFALLIGIGFLIRSKGGVDFGIGFWFLLIASIGMFVGAILQLQKPASSSPPPAPPAA